MGTSPQHDILTRKKTSIKIDAPGCIDGKVSVIVKNSTFQEKNLAFKFSKRAFDIIFSLLFGTIFLSWLIPLLAFLIKLDSKGPVFFRQLRTGYRNEPFICLKFRTMIANKHSNTKQASHSDPRITKLGHFLRNTNLDELPQFWNVLKGEMSLIGPRPHMIKHTQEFSDKLIGYNMRHRVKPGISGLAQVKGWRGTTPTFRSVYKRIQWDCYYVRHQKITMDVYIFFATFIEVSANFFHSVYSICIKR